MKKSAEEIGFIGESIAIRHLLATGFQLVQFGKAVSSKSRKVETHDGLALLPDYGVGSSFGCFSLLPTAKENLWQESTIPPWADLTYDEIKALASECRMRKVCAMRDRAPSSAPCACIERFLDKDWLTSLTPHNPRSVNLVVDGVRVVTKGHNLIDICLTRINRLVIDRYKNDVASVKSFVVANIIVTDYIQRKEWMNNELHGGLGDDLPHSGDAIRDALKSLGAAEAKRLQEENRTAMKKKPRYKMAIGHPGRYDFVGYKDGYHYAIEVKANSSTLSNWQKVRLGILNKLGFKTLLIRVELGESQLSGGDGALSLFPPIIEEVCDLSFNDADIPSIEEIQKVLNYQATHERARAGLTEELRDRFGYD